MKTLLSFAVLLGLLSLTGCQTPPVTGLPEVTISTSDASNIKALIIADSSPDGFIIEQNTAAVLTISQVDKGGVVAPAAGTIPSTRKIFVTYTFSHVGDATRIVATSGWSQMEPGSSRPIITDTTATSKESLQHRLDVIKKRVEDGAQKIIP